VAELDDAELWTAERNLTSDETTRLRQLLDEIRASLDAIEISLRTAERDVALDENARLRRLLDEIRASVQAPGSANDKVHWLIVRLRA
jgi:hypothetical protein